VRVVAFSAFCICLDDNEETLLTSTNQGLSRSLRLSDDYSSFDATSLPAEVKLIAARERISSPNSTARTLHARSRMPRILIPMDWVVDLQPSFTSKFRKSYKQAAVLGRLNDAPPIIPVVA
jgi:hypothetical protein